MYSIRYLREDNRILRAYGCEVDVPCDLEYITRINAVWHGREKNMRFALFTPGQWNSLSEIGELAAEFAFGGDFRNYIDDSVLIQERVGECENWHSPKLNTWLREHCGTTLVAALICEFEKSDFLASFEILSEDDRAKEVISGFPEDFLQDNGIKAALNVGNISDAKRLFAEHFKSRAFPVFPVSDCSDEDLEIADMACSHIFQPKPIVHQPEKVEPFDWKADPMNFAQWVIAQNRHNHWSSLARAYDKTGDEKYACEYSFELCEWLKEIPIFVDHGVAFIIGTVYEPGRLSHYLDAGFRLVGSWWESFEILRRSKSVTSDDVVKFIDGVVSQADYIADSRAEDIYGNWGAAAAAGLLTASVMLPEHSRARSWLDIAVKRIKRILEAQFYPDGAQIELTPTYQCGVLDHIITAVKIANVNGTPLDIDVSRFEKIFEYLLKIATPNRTAPAFNDSPWKPLAQVFKTAHSMFADRADFLWFADEGKSGKIPDDKSVFLPYAGYAIMRTGYTDDDLYTAFDVGPYGFSHQHEDKLNFVITYGKTTLLTEGGVYNYDYSPHHMYALSSRAHNVILVDGLPQRRADKRDTHTTDNPIDAGWISNSEFDYAKGIYCDGFSDGNSTVNVIHQREIRFEKRHRKWHVCDTLIPDDDQKHRYKALFHFDSEEIIYTPEENKITVRRDGKKLTLCPMEKLSFSVEIINGAIEPEVQGWARIDSGEVVPRPVVSFVWEAEGEVTVNWNIEVE